MDDFDRFYVTPADVERAGTADDALVWYVAQTNPQCEFKAAAHLFERGFIAYLPVEVNWHRPTRRGRAAPERVAKAKPLMTGYLFVGMGREQSVYRIRQTDGIRGLVGIEGTPFEIPASAIDKIRDREDRGVFDHTRPTRARHQAGDEVKVISGPFAGHLGQVLEAIPDGKLRVALAGLFSHGLPLDDDQVEARKAA